MHLEAKYQHRDVGGESANSSEVNMVEGKADFKGEVIQINVNMYFDKTAECFQEKKVSGS